MVRDPLSWICRQMPGGRFALAVTTVLSVMLAGQASAALPDDRQYELVSPSDKNGGDVLLANSRSRASDDGGAFTFASLVGFADVKGTAVSTEYMARRTNTGWLTHGITPRQDALNGFLVFQGPGDAVFEGEFSADLSTGLVRANAFPQEEPNVATVQNLFLRRDLLTPGLGSYELVTPSVVPIPAPWTGVIFPPPPEIVPIGYKPSLAGTSDDFTHVLFESILNLTQRTVDANLPRGPADFKVYEWVNGTVRDVGVLPENEGGSVVRAIAGPGASPPIPFYASDAISNDGRRVLFVTSETQQLYMRIDGANTLRISASESSTPSPTPAPARFRTSTPDGMRVFFTSEEALTDGATGGNSLWRWDGSAPEGARLTQLSVDGVPGDRHSPPVVGVLGVSDDGEWAYFIAEGQLIPDMPAAGITDPIIYQWHSGRLRYVGRLRRGLQIETRAAGEAEWFGDVKTSRVTSDGNHVLWVTREGDQLTPHDHSRCGDFPCEEIYAFDAEANGGDGRVVCVSCDPGGGPSTGENRFVTHVATGGAVRSSHLTRAMTEDGRFVFFQSSERLSDDDKNDRYDVYEYDLRDDRIALISSGRADARDSYFMDASASGEDVFFATRERLVGWDVDGSYDIYDARVNGGFPEPARPVPPCIGDTCQGSSRAVPAVTIPSSRSFRGDGNVKTRARKAARRCRRGKVRRRVDGRVRCVTRRAAGHSGRRSARGR